MQKRLNIDAASSAMEERGFTQSTVADSLGVSKEAVSKWLKEKTFPRPLALLKLGRLLELKFSELVIKEASQEPIVAYRKVRGSKTKDHHIEEAKEMGCFLKHLVPYSPYEKLEMPPILKSPSCDYDYLQEVSKKVRKDIKLTLNDKLDFEHLIRRFSELQAVVVPVLWGKRKAHGNAIHIYLPDSKSTWVYLNLDVNIHDFKFWMAHELGHCLSPGLSGEEAEDFADAFAGALLFPEAQSKKAYEQLISQETELAMLKCLMDFSKNQLISAFTIYKEANKYALRHKRESIKLDERKLGARVTNFNKRYKNVSDLFVDDGVDLNAREYLEKAEVVFETPFFRILSEYLSSSQKGFGYIQAVTNMNLLDSKAIYTEIT